MSILAAASFHAEVPDLAGPLVARAVFPRTWHLQTAVGPIVSVTTAPYDGPFAVRIDADHLPAGAVAVGAAGVLYPTRLLVGSIEIDLSRGTRWTGRWLQAGADFDLARLMVDRDAVCRAVVEAGDSGLLLPNTAWVGAGTRALAGIRLALQVGGSTGLLAALIGLIGLGPGLTPAGDDVLVGLLVGLHGLGRRAGKLEATVVRETLEVAWPSLAPRTTALSRTLLQAAQQGLALQPLLDLLCMLGRPTADTDDRDALLRLIVGLGHTSGRDMLTGVHLAATAVLGWEETRGPTLVRSA